MPLGPRLVSSLIVLTIGCRTPPTAADGNGRDGDAARSGSDAAASGDTDAALGDTEQGADPLLGDVDADGGPVGGDAQGEGDAALGGDAAPMTCTSCHGSGDESAPPRDVSGATDVHLPGVGAHRRHLGAKLLFRTGVCSDCHRVPAAADDPGHIDPAPAELVWSSVAAADGAVTSYDGTCNLYCHGQTLAGGVNTRPSWTAVGEGEAACGTCHGVPPGGAHPAVAGFACGPCHPFAGSIPEDPERHVDGILDVAVECTSCHGGPDGPAPPRDTTGHDATSATGVGAHASHLAPSTEHAAIACSECHVVPGSVGAVGHLDGDGVAEVVFGGMASGDGAAPTWDGTQCATYCHGQTLSGGANTTPLWTTVDGTQAACGSCHGLPPTSGHTTLDQCSLCHGAVVDAGRNIIDASLHVNGTVESGATCGSCHALPPATGAHAVHAALASPTYGGLGTAAEVAGATSYAFGCGQCHPRDGARHMNGGLAEIELYDPSAPASSLKALNPPSAAYTPGAVQMTDAHGLSYTLGSCGEVYCHSGVVTTSDAVPKPGIDFPFNGYPITYPPYSVARTRAYRGAGWGAGSLDCAGCHGYAPRADSPAASAGESHAFLAPSGFELLHVWNHGFAPVPCRTCHAATVLDVPAYSRDAGGDTSFADASVAPARHVDGRSDVAFDPAGFTYARRGSPVSRSLAGASWDPAARSCSNVSCHGHQTSVVFGAPYRADNAAECNLCHRF